MNICVYTGVHGTEWCAEMLPSLCPAELAIGGREWCLHAIDLCSQLPEVKEVFFADCLGSTELPIHINRENYWSLSMHYLPTSPFDTPAQLLKHFPEIPQDDDLLIFWGQVLPDLDDLGQLLQKLTPAPATFTLDDLHPSSPLPNGLWLLRKGQLYHCDCPLHRMDTLQNYFNLNFRFLNHPGIFTLPGYSLQQGFGIGKNVIIMPECTLEPPLNIQNESCLGKCIQIEGDVIIGKNALIDDHTVLKHTIIMDSTYVGKHLYLEDKLVCLNRIIDVNTNCYVDLTEDFLAADIKLQQIDRFRIVGFFLGLLLIITLAPFYLLAWPLKWWLKKYPTFTFLFRIYPQCWKVVLGKANLVRLGPDDPSYVFRMSDLTMVPISEERREMEDRLYYHHRTIRTMIGVVIGSLLKRLFFRISGSNLEQNGKNSLDG